MVMTKEDIEFFENLGVSFEGDGAQYNQFAISEGILISEILGDENKIIEFNKLSFQEQRELVPISDEHSGGTWGIAIRAAIAYLPIVRAKERDRKISNIID